MMGECADDMINGLTCSWCGIFFEEAHGYAVICSGCSKGHSNKELEKLDVQRATEKEL